MESKRNVEECITYGPWGDSWRQRWSYLPKSFINCKITVWHGDFIRSIEFQTYSSTCIVGDSKSKVDGGHRSDTFCIDYPSEYIVSIRGTFGRCYCDETTFDGVKSICFKTNEHTYGPFGTKGDTAFSYDSKDDEVIVGFHGRVDDYLSAIGVYVMPKSLAFVQIATSEGEVTHQMCSSMPDMVMPREPGPWGASGGKPWDDGVFSTIKQIRVHLGLLNVIYALQFEYMKKDGKSVMSQIHGGTNGTEIELVNLDGNNDEYLIGISGYYGPVEEDKGSEAIVSITFHTNKRMYGPYGKERGAGYVYYSSTASPGKVVGFHGWSNGFLGAIGVHMEYF